MERSMMPADPELITVARAAEIIGCSRLTIKTLHQTGLLEMRKIGYRQPRVVRASAERLAADPTLRPPDDKPRRMRLREAADYIGITPDALYRLRGRGEGPPFLMIGKIILYDVRDIDTWLASHRQPV